MSTRTCPACSEEVFFGSKLCVACGAAVPDDVPENPAEESSVLASPSPPEAPEEQPPPPPPIDTSGEAPDSPLDPSPEQGVSPVDTADDPPSEQPPEPVPPPVDTTDDPPAPPSEQAPEQAPPSEPPTTSLTPPPSGPSSSPNLEVGYLLSHAWERFKERPGLCIGMWVIYGLVTGAGGGGGTGSGGSGNAEVDGVIALLAVAFGLVFGCVAFVLGGPIRGGYDLAMVRHSRGDTSLEFGDMFAGFSKMLNLFLTQILFSLAFLVGFCLCVIPAFIAGLTLWPAFLLVMEDDLSPIDAIKAAWELTRPHLGALFVLGLACLFINLAGLLACCIGLLVTGPVTQLAFATAYREIRGS